MMKKLLLAGLLIGLALPLQARRILYIGDSVTDGGWGRSGGNMMPSAERNHKDLNHLYGHSYMMLCAAHYESRDPESGDEFLNRGISGDDLTRLEARWEADVVALQPDVLSLLVGINDVYYHVQQRGEATFDFEAWERRYRALLDRARAANPDLVILLGTPFVAPVGKTGAAADYPRCEALVHRLAEIVTALAADYDATVLHYDELFAAQATLHPTVPMRHWIWDGIHPTAAGHRLMADLWIDRFDRLGR